MTKFILSFFLVAFLFLIPVDYETVDYEENYNIEGTDLGYSAYFEDIAIGSITKNIINKPLDYKIESTSIFRIRCTLPTLIIVGTTHYRRKDTHTKPVECSNDKYLAVMLKYKSRHSKEYIMVVNKNGMKKLFYSKYPFNRTIE